MPAASAEKRARQRANRLLRTESASEPTILVTTASVSESVTANESSSWPTPAPMSFTITYSPLSISYPEPVDPAAHLLSDAVRVTRNELAMMLRQSYIYGTEHGWKANVDTARERLQAEYEKDMQDGTTKFAEHEKQIRTEEFTRGFDEAQIQLKTQLDSMTEDLNTKHEEKVQHALADVFERQQEWRDDEYVQAFALGRTTGIQDEHEYQDSVCKIQIDVGIQVRPTTASISIQSTPSIISSESSSTATISTQTEPPIPTITLSDSAPVPIFESPIPDTTASAPFNWADDAAILPTIPTIPPKQPRDLSSLRSSSKNPFSSLRRRHRYSNRSQILSSCQHTHSYPTHPPTHHTPPLLNNLLDWHRDPRLFELSRVLRTLGWSHP
jgi:hypothetical protein